MLYIQRAGGSRTSKITSTQIYWWLVVVDHGADEVTKEVNVREGVVEVELYGVIELVVDTGQPKIWWNIPKNGGVWASETSTFWI